MADRLRAQSLSAGYGATVVLRELSFALGAGEALAVLGRNGMGKTTLIESIAGLTTCHGGALFWGEERIERWPTWRRARAGIGLVPQEREIFPSLSVEENLAVAHRGGEWTPARAFDLFPRLGVRRRHRGNQLSGGEQQMLAIARALMSAPKVLLLDEPLEGLAPVIIDSVLTALERLRDEGGMAMLLVEQHARLAMQFAPRALVLVRGRAVYDGPSAPIAADPARLGSLIGIGPSGGA